MKKTLVFLLAITGVAASVSAQLKTVYRWDFKNGDGTPAVDGGSGALNIVQISGVATPPLVSFASTGGPWGTNGCYLVPDNGQGYSSGNTYAATATNLTGIGALNQYTVTFWFKFGPTVPGQFPRLVQFGSAPNYDAGGKGDAHNGTGASINGWNTDGTSYQMQDGLGNSGANQNTLFTLTNAFPLLTSNNWYFCAMTYDGTLGADNFRVYLGSPTLSVTNIGSAPANYGAINFGNNATVMIGNDEIPSTARALSSGAIADVRLLTGVADVQTLDLIRLVLTNPPPAGGPPSFVTQPQSGSSYVSGTRSLSAGVSGSFPFAFQWHHASTNLPSATNATLTLTNIQLGDAGVYSVTVTNFLGATNSATATIGVLTAPANSFAAAVLANHPYAYWHLNEANPNPGSTAPVSIYDYVGGHDGLAANPSNMLFSVSGPAYTGFPLFTTAVGVVSNGAPSLLAMPPIAGYTNISTTILGWVYLRGNLAPGGLIMARDLNNGGFGNCWGLEICRDTNNPVTDFNQLGFEWGADVPGFQNTDFLTNGAVGETGLHLPTNEWVFIAFFGGDAFAPTTVYMGDSHTNLQRFPYYGIINDYAPNAGSLCLGYDPIGNGGGNPSTLFANVNFSDVAVFYTDVGDAGIESLYRAGLGSGVALGLKCERSGSNIVVKWTTGTLQQSVDAAGPYTNVPGATSPYTVSANGPRMFFRAKMP